DRPEPVVDRPPGRRRERQLDPPPGPGRLVGGHQDLDHGPAVLARLLGRPVLLHAGDEVVVLLREAVAPELLEDGVGPALLRRRAGPGLAVAALAVGADAGLLVEVGLNHAVGPEDLEPVLHAAALAPAVLRDRDDPVAELDHDQRVILTLAVVDVAAHV